MTARPFRRPHDLRLLLELEQELWQTRDEVVCTFGQIAFWSAQLLHADWDAAPALEGPCLGDCPRARA